MSTYNNIDGTNKKVNDTKVNIDGTWRSTYSSYSNVNGVWKDNDKKYTITIIHNNTTEQMQCSVGDSITLPSFTGINGYNSNTTGTNIVYNTGQVITPSGNMTLYSVTLYTISIYFNGSLNTTLTYRKGGNPITLPSTLSGTSIVGYTAVQGDGSIDYFDYFINIDLTFTKNITLYALVYNPGAKTTSAITGKSVIHILMENQTVTFKITSKVSSDITLNNNGLSPYIKIEQLTKNGTVTDASYISASFSPSSPISKSITIANNGGFVRITRVISGKTVSTTATTGFSYNVN